MVRLPNDTLNSKTFDKKCEELSGQVTTYFLEGYGKA